MRPFGTSVVLPPGLPVSGEILTSRVRSIDTLARPILHAGTVPAAILSALPPSANISESGISIGGGIIIVSSSTTAPATVPGVDDFSAGASSGDGKIGVTFQ